MSATERRDSPAEAIAGILAALSLTASAIALAYRPVRVIPFAVIAALVAARIGGRHQRLATAAVMISAAAWLVGMTIAVLTENPLF